MTTRRGAPAAYRGYRLQALYTLDRLLAPSIYDDLVLQPEGKEDLDILQGDRLIEVVQVKSYDSLTLSDLEPNEPDSFFQRVVRLADESEHLRILLVNFGTLGPQIQKAWKSESPQRRTIVAKLNQAGLSDQGVATLLERVELVTLDENEVRERVIAFLQESLVGVDAESAFDLLNFWLYLKAEHRSPITRQEVIERITGVGRFLAERYTYHQEWFTSIIPLEEEAIDEARREALRTEYFAGIAARFEHILVDLDFLRPRWLQIIQDGFAQHNVVIIHAASGQGKTTLAFRYLREHYPATWCFRIELIRDRQHVLSIVRALAGFATAVQMPMAIYIDVSPRDTDWSELVQRLAPNPLFHVLVTIREEDLRRSAPQGATFTYADVELSFDREDAHELYERAVASLPMRRFLDFDEAWDVFGGHGPLLEFVYLLTQTTTLRDRLLSQVARIREEIRHNRRPAEELRLLQLVAVASAYEARIDVTALAQTMTLPDLAWSLEQFEREYLVRLSEDRRTVEGLHPVRSQLLVQLLTDPALSPWGSTAKQVLPLLYEADIESFLLHAFVDRPAEELMLLEFVRTHVWQSWTGLAGAGRALIWSAIRVYVDANRPVIHEAHNTFGSAWWLVLNFDIVGLAENTHEEWIDMFKGITPTDRHEQISLLLKQQTSKEALFEPLRKWLIQQSRPSQSPTSTSDWAGVAHVWYWLSWLGVLEHAVVLDVDEYALDAAVSNLDFDTLADLSLALSCLDRTKQAQWFSRHETVFHERMAREYQIVALEPSGETLTTHYLLDRPDIGSSSSGDASSSKSLHSETMERLFLTRRLIPDYSFYGTQAYGHNFGEIIPLPVDDTRKKGMSTQALHPIWYISPNIIAHGLAWHDFRPDSWQDFASLALDLRHSVMAVLEQLISALKTFAQQGNKQGKTRIFEQKIDIEEWQRCRRSLGTRTRLPKVAVDPWGFGGERLNEQWQHSQQHSPFVSAAIVTQKYNPYLKAERAYTSSLSAFLMHAVDVIVTNVKTAHLPKSTPAYERVIALLQERGRKTDRVHLSTNILFQARDALDEYQSQFRSLFGSLINTDELATVEQQEQEVLSRLCPIWYFFAHQPEQRWASPFSQIEGQIRSAQRELRDRLRQACAATMHPDARAILHEEIGLWGKDSAAWIQLDTTDPRQLYNALEMLLQSLRTSLGQVSYEELLSYIIQEKSSYIAIIPTYAGRSLNRSAWRLHTRMTIMSEVDFSQREMRWKFLPQLIPDENWSRLNIPFWQPPEMAVVDRLTTSVSTLYVLMARLSVLLQLPDVTEPGSEAIHAFVKTQANLSSEQLQQYYAAVTDLKEQVARLSQECLLLRPSWAEVKEGLTELNQLIQPPEIAPDQQGFPISEISAYVPRLEQAAGIAEVMKLFWLHDIIANEEAPGEM